MAPAIPERIGVVETEIKHLRLETERNHAEASAHRLKVEHDMEKLQKTVQGLVDVVNKARGAWFATTIYAGIVSFIVALAVHLLKLLK